MSFNFLIQATRVLDKDNLSENELDMVYMYVISLDNDILNDYNNTCTILSYDNDLELYLEIIDALIKIYEEKEEYEKCSLLIQKKEDATIIIENKNI
jgi:hypothetical protein